MAKNQADFDMDEKLSEKIRVEDYILETPDEPQTDEEHCLQVSDSLHHRDVTQRLQIEIYRDRMRYYDKLDEWAERQKNTQNHDIIRAHVDAAIYQTNATYKQYFNAELTKMILVKEARDAAIRSHFRSKH